MSLNHLLSSLLKRLQAHDDPWLLIQFDEAREWPDGALDALIASGLVTSATPAKTVVCNGCEEECSMPVHVIPGNYPRAFIMCNEYGRVPVDLKRLQQWQLHETTIVDALMDACDDDRLTKELILENLSSIPLHNILSLQRGQLRVDCRGLSHDSPTTTDAPLPNRFALTGDHWNVTFDGQTGSFRNTKGMRYIAWLLQNQGKEVLVSDLYYAINPPDREIKSTNPEDNETDAPDLTLMSEEQLADFDLSISDLGDAGSILTAEERKRLEQAVRDFQEHIDEAKERGEDEKQATLEAQQEAILHHITTTTGLGGKPRKASSNIERQRKAVSKRIRSDIKKLTESLPVLGHHLNETLRTGTFCQYSPHPPVEWFFEPK